MTFEKQHLLIRTRYGLFQKKVNREKGGLRIKKTKINPREIWQIFVLFKSQDQKQRPLEILCHFFLVTLGNYTSFLINCWKFHYMLFLWYSWKFHILNPPPSCPVLFFSGVALFSWNFQDYLISCNK